MAAGDELAVVALREAENRNGEIAVAYAVLALRAALVELLGRECGSGCCSRLVRTDLFRPDKYDDAA